MLLENRGTLPTMRPGMQKVRLQQGDQIFKFLNIKHRDHKDGTLIIVFR